MAFIRDVLCAPYSIPIGLINNKRTIGMCGETTKKELKLKETTTNSKGYKGSIGTQTEDVSSITNYEMLNLGIQDILRRNQTVVSQTVRAENKAKIDCPLVVPLEEDPLATYDTKLRNVTEVKELKDGTTVELPAFGCCPPVVSQITTINASSWENITEIDIEDIEAGETTENKTFFNKTLLKKYGFYFKEIIHIFTKEGRMFHTGIFLLFISIIIYFVDSTK